ncbi:MAG: O-antigen ligase family protein [Patescibacteria group bacterium]
MKEISYKKTAFKFFGFVLLFLCFVLLYIWVGYLPLAVFFILFLAWAVSYRLDIGWYILVFISPLINWVISFERFPSFFSGFYRLEQVNAPAVEFWAILLLIAFVINKFRGFFKGESEQVNLPGFHLFALFILSAVVSLINLSSVEIVGGIKYIFHFLLLFYFGYVMLGANIANDKKIWEKSLAVFASIGFLGAAMGFVSFVFGWGAVAGGMRRAAPFSIGGWAPFGDQHIFLAETITSVLPIFLYFWYKNKNTARGKYYGAATIFVLIIGLLTLSRAGWLTMAVEAVVFVYLMRKKIDFKKYARKFQFLIAIFIVPLFVYLVYFLTASPIVRSSTAARWYLANISWFLFKEHPFIGQGVGSFLSRAGEIGIFRFEFGDPLDAHGIAQKLLAEQGIFGLLTFGLFIGWIVFIIYKRYRDERYTEEARLAYFVSLFLVLSPLIFQLFNTQFYSSKMWVPIALAVAQSIAYSSETLFANLKINFARKKKFVSKI